MATSSILGVPKEDVETDETTPLLAESIVPPIVNAAEQSGVTESRSQDAVHVSEAVNDGSASSRQIFLLCLASTVDPISYFCIFPYISEMIERTGGVAMVNVGFYAGLVEALFSAVQLPLFLIYGRLADKYGRKPVLIFSLFGTGLCNALFGLSGSLWQIFLFRGLAGAFAGSSVTIRSMISESASKQSQGSAFSRYAFSRALSIALGPAVGGGLANPAVRYPDIFGHWDLFVKYPYALPGFTASVASLLPAVICHLFLRETLDRASLQSQPKMSIKQILGSPGVKSLLAVNAHFFVIGLSYTAVVPVVLYTYINYGGMQFPPQWIATVICFMGLCQAAWMLLAFPTLQRRFGAANILRTTAAGWPIFIAAWPLCNELLRLKYNAICWAVGIPALLLGSGLSTGYTCVQLCTNDVAPNPAVLATVNALALIVSSAVRSVFPAIATAIFAAGVNSGWAHGHLWWIVFIPITIAMNFTVRALPSNVGRRVQTVKVTD